MAVDQLKSTNYTELPVEVQEKILLVVPVATLLKSARQVNALTRTLVLRVLRGRLKNMSIMLYSMRGEDLLILEWDIPVAELFSSWSGILELIDPEMMKFSTLEETPRREQMLSHLAVKCGQRCLDFMRVMLGYASEIVYESGGGRIELIFTRFNVDTRKLPAMSPFDRVVDDPADNPLLEIWSASYQRVGEDAYLCLPPNRDGGPSAWHDIHHTEYPSDKIYVRASYEKAFTIFYKTIRNTNKQLIWLWEGPQVWERVFIFDTSFGGYCTPMVKKSRKFPRLSF
jgi:hypothetical protein